METWCTNKFKLVQNSQNEVEKCKNPLGYCKLQCSNIDFYARFNHKCLLNCLDK